MSTNFPEIEIPTEEAVGSHTLTFWPRKITTAQMMIAASLSTVQNLVITEQTVTEPLKSSWTLAPQCVTTQSVTTQSVTALSHDTGDPELAPQGQNQHS
ncbi:unnamed protein product [Pleuronectes platessa]|uniref:Uncharacterized protein n=1 Tax=Pleuronectes platessa TaxID=8262 RepID=A0A9N7YNG8_PLEPL|nr:unnamed protein product [Pleuronectes platessa]